MTALLPVKSIRAGRGGVPIPTGQSDSEVHAMPQVLPKRQRLYRIVGITAEGKRRVWYPRHRATARNRVRILRSQGQLVRVDVADIEWRQVDPEALAR